MRTVAMWFYRIAFVLSFAMLALVLATKGHSAGFDCRKAKLPAEMAICADATVNGMDSEMASFYFRSYSRMHGNDKSAFAAEQRIWIAFRNQCYWDTGCLRLTYFARWMQMCNLLQWEDEFCAEVQNDNGE